MAGVRIKARTALAHYTRVQYKTGNIPQMTGKNKAMALSLSKSAIALNLRMTGHRTSGIQSHNLNNEGIHNRQHLCHR